MPLLPGPVFGRWLEALDEPGDDVLDLAGVQVLLLLPTHSRSSLLPSGKKHSPAFHSFSITCMTSIVCIALGKVLGHVGGEVQVAVCDDLNEFAGALGPEAALVRFAAGDLEDVRFGANEAYRRRLIGPSRFLLWRFSVYITTIVAIFAFLDLSPFFRRGFFS